MATMLAGAAAAAAALLLIVLLQEQQVVFGAPESARVTSVPGFSSHRLPSAHYAGYIRVSETSDRELYYYFVTSESHTAATDPLVLWLNGGPGCSSFDGFIYEHGPFRFEPPHHAWGLPKLTRNPYSWAKVANVIYLDSPAGVGMSYSKNKTDYITGDLKTASDAYKFLQLWFAEYPEYLFNPFFIAGESYAGVYVPNLSREVADGIQAGLQPTLNFKGYLVGNGVTDEEYDGNALVPFVHGMGLISSDLYKGAYKACSGNYWNDSSPTCIKAQNQIYDVVADINVYDILEPCFHSEGAMASERLRKLPESFRRLGERQSVMQVRKRMFGRSWPLRLRVGSGPVPTWGYLQDSEEVPCTDDSIANVWLNNPLVRKAIHASPIKEIGKWELCTDDIVYHHDSGSMIPIHVNLTMKGYRALIFSGDHDMCVPYTGSEAWTRSLGYAITDKWRPWFLGAQVAGFTQGYANGLTFATIKGSGHTVPEYKPAEALAFFTRFLLDQPL